MIYEIFIPEKIEKKLRKISAADRSDIFLKIDSLSINPRNENCKKIHGHHPPLYRIRAGVYRIVYSINANVLTVLIVDVGHRKDVYKKL